MVTLIRSAALNGVDKQLKARDWAKKATEYVSGRFGFSTIECGVEVLRRLGVAVQHHAPCGEAGRGGDGDLAG